MTEFDASIRSLISLSSGKIFVLPGDCITKHENDIIPSSGTYLKNTFIYSSLAGFVRVEEHKEFPQDELSQETDHIVKRVVKVERSDVSKKISFLEPGSIVTCRVLRLTSSWARCAICAIEDQVLKKSYTGVIRLEDVHKSERSCDLTIQKTKLMNCFRPGDIILARVIAPGENHQFLLTTASDNLGVVVAQNDWGEPMIPISVNQVFCQRTLRKEARKVANLDFI